LISRALIVAVVMGLPAAALDPHKSLHQYSATIWTQQQGLPDDTVRAIAQTSDGYLWIGTGEGLARFDGYEFVVFDASRGDLSSNAITALAAASDGSLWIGTAAGLTHYSNGKFRMLTNRDGLPEGGITNLFVDREGLVWMIVGGSVSRYDGKSFTSFLRDRNLPMRSARALAMDKENRILVAGLSSVARLESDAAGGRFVTILSEADLATDFPVGIQVDRSSNVWVVGVRGVARRSPDGRVDHYSLGDGRDPFGLSTVLADRDGNLWVGTPNGVSRLERGVFRTVTEFDRGEPANEWTRLGNVRALFEDGEGNLWIGSTGGLTRLTDNSFAVYGRNEGMPADPPTAVFEDDGGTKWLGLNEGGVATLSGGRLHAMNGSGMPKGRVLTIRPAQNGGTLISSRDGLTIYRNGQARLFVPPDPHARKTVYDAFEDPAGNVWVGTPNGLGKISSAGYRTIVAGGPTIEEGAVVILTGAPDGSLWSGSLRRGLSHVKGDEVRTYTGADGLNGDDIRALHIDSRGTVWIGTSGGGLHSLRDGKFTTYLAKDGLLSDNISHLLDDGDSLWIGTARGLSRIAMQQLNDFAEKKISSLRPANYGIADGLPSLQVTGGYRRADGSLWFLTRRGFAAFQPRPERHSEKGPELHIVDFSADGNSFDWRTNPRVPPGASRVRIRFAAIHFSAPGLVEYSYKLDGLDAAWVRSDNRRVVDYTNLASGHYRFLVRAEVPGSPIDESFFEFDLLPHFYERRWFQALALLAIGVLAWLAYHMRVRQVRSRFSVVLEERARLAREIHDTLSQSFIGIASQLEAAEMFLPEDAVAARNSIDIARRMARHSHTEARRAVLDLRSTALDDRNLAAALDSGGKLWTVGSGLNVTVNVEGDSELLPENVAHNALRIAQEAVTNAVKHARASNLTLKLRVDAAQLKLTVSDDGCGFEGGEAFNTASGHFGMIGMRERAKRMGGRLELKSSPGAGTEIALTVPLT
jgi:signal transduction histidine kinase/ligand-binding sensor domain-containing protein